MFTEIKGMSKTDIMAEANALKNVKYRLLDIIENNTINAKEYAQDIYRKLENHWYVDPTKSPIERLLWSEILFMSDGYEYVGVLDVPEKDYSNEKTWVLPQGQVGKYKADFLFSVHSFGGERQLIAVECDGHDFHEKTKEQAKSDKKRDRFFTQHGVKFLRFTGSEIYADVEACCDEIQTVLSNIVDDGLRQRGII